MTLIRGNVAEDRQLTAEELDGGRWRTDRPVRRAARELALVAALFLAYKVGRVAAMGHVELAMGNAHDLWRLERWLHLPSELALQHAVIAHVWLVKAANCYYAYVHVPVTAGSLIGLYLYRPAHYLRTRRRMAWLTGAALVVHLLIPLAPPRLLTQIGIVDTGRLFGPSVYGSPDTDTLTNQYAAMPSLHVAWALAVAIALVAVTRGRRRWLWLAHPLLTLLVVVVTGNHYWLDVVCGCALLGVVIAVQTYRARFTDAVTVAVPRRAVEPEATGG